MARLATLTWLRWLAIVPIIVTLPILFFGVIWAQLGMVLIGSGLLAAAAGVWVVFAVDD